MKVKVKFFAYYREIFQDREREIILPEGARLRRLLMLLCDSPERRRAVFKEEDILSPETVFMKNGVPIQSSGGLETFLADGDIVAIFPFLGGG